jgi:hypothetical protein
MKDCIVISPSPKPTRPGVQAYEASCTCCDTCVVGSLSAVTQWKLYHKCKNK